jgi:starvation-inducible DNA-binding protein
MTDMKSAQSTPTSSIDPDISAGVAQFLAPVVVDLTALATDGKQAHWHVRGPNFQEVHELLDVVVEHARDYADLAAERVVALGLPLDARTRTIGEKTTTPVMSEGFQQADTVLREMIAALDATIATVRTAVDELDEIDLVSQDIAIEIARGLDKDRWFLFSHLAK